MPNLCHRCIVTCGKSGKRNWTLTVIIEENPSLLQDRAEMNFLGASAKSRAFQNTLQFMSVTRHRSSIRTETSSATCWPAESWSLSYSWSSEQFGEVFFSYSSSSSAMTESVGDHRGFRLERQSLASACVTLSLFALDAVAVLASTSSSTATLTTSSGEPKKYSFQTGTDEVVQQYQQKLVMMT